MQCRPHRQVWLSLEDLAGGKDLTEEIHMFQIRVGEISAESSRSGCSGFVTLEVHLRLAVDVLFDSGVRRQHGRREEQIDENKQSSAFLAWWIAAPLLLAGQSCKSDDQHEA